MLTDREVAMLKKYIFFYLMKNESEKIPMLVPKHVKYWEENKSVDSSGGPFGDRSGGLILFEAEEMNAAKTLAMNDPFVLEQVIERKWVKEWMQEQ